MSNDPQDRRPDDTSWHPPGGQPPAAPGPAVGWQAPGVPAGPGPRPAGTPWGESWGSGASRWGGLQPGPPQQSGYVAPPKPGVIPLRPLGLGEILDGAFQACRRNPLSTFGTAILFQSFVAVVTVLMSTGLITSLDQINPETASPEQLGGLLASLASFTTVISVVSGGALLVLQGVLVIPVARAVLNQRTGFGQLWRLSARRLLPLLLLGVIGTIASALVVGVVVLIAVAAAAAMELYSLYIIIPLALALAAGAVWVSIKLVVAPAALMLEGTGPLHSFRRSWSLTRGNWWRTFGILILTSIMVSIISTVIATPVSFLVTALFSFSDAPAASTMNALDSLPVLLITQGITSFFAAIGYAFQAGVTALLYIDLRIRREGFDVVLMKEHERSVDGVPGFPAGGTGQFGAAAPEGRRGWGNPA